MVLHCNLTYVTYLNITPNPERRAWTRLQEAKTTEESKERCMSWLRFSSKQGMIHLKSLQSSRIHTVTANKITPILVKDSRVCARTWIFTTAGLCVAFECLKVRIALCWVFKAWNEFLWVPQPTPILAYMWQGLESEHTPVCAVTELYTVLGRRDCSGAGVGKSGAPPSLK